MSYKFLVKKGPLFAFLLAAVVIVVSMIPIFSGLEDFNNVPTAQQSYAPESNIFLVAIYLTATLLVIAVAAAILLSVFQVLKNPKGAIRSLISFAALIAVFIILFAISGGDDTGSLADTVTKFNISDTISKMIGSGLRLTMILGAGSVLMIIAMEAWNYFKTN
jgi:phosphoglycerol transferase MdoB-like AlkP superfamily enzyme